MEEKDLEKTVVIKPTEVKDEKCEHCNHCENCEDKKYAQTFTKKSNRFGRILIIILLFILGIAVGITCCKLYERYTELDSKNAQEETKVDEEVKEPTTNCDDETNCIDESKIAYVVEYSKENYNVKSTDGKIVVNNERNIIKITSPSNQAAADKVTKYMNALSDKEWKGIKETSDETIKAGESYGDVLGVKLMINTDVVNNDYISLRLNTEGTFGGTGWGTNRVYTFNQNGDVLKLSDVVNNPTAIYNIIISEITKNVPSSDLMDDWKDLVKKSYMNPGNFSMNEKGIIYNFDKYEIANGAAGVISGEIPYSLVKNYMKN